MSSWPMPMAGKWRGFCPACGQSVSLREGEQWLLPAGCLLNVSHVTCQWQRDVAEVCDPGHLDVLFCQLQPHSVKTKGFVLFVMELSTLSPESFWAMLVSRAISAGYILLLSEPIHPGSTPECTSDKAKVCFTNTPSCLSFTLEIGPAKMNSCIWEILCGGKSKGWGDVESALCLLSQSVLEGHYSALGVGYCGSQM